MVLHVLLYNNIRPERYEGQSATILNSCVLHETCFMALSVSLSRAINSNIKMDDMRAFQKSSQNVLIAPQWLDAVWVVR